VAIDFAISYAHSMNFSASGLKVRFFSVMMDTGHGRAGKSTGKAFKPKRAA
jgi:hypothetical protein